jgi:hypothetical protein
MMTMYILVLMVLTDPAVAITSVPGFATREACMRAGLEIWRAGIETTLRGGPGKHDVRYTCVTNTGE